jgi:hypothetical protein
MVFLVIVKKKRDGFPVSAGLDVWVLCFVLGFDLASEQYFQPWLISQANRVVNRPVLLVS